MIFKKWLVAFAMSFCLTLPASGQVKLEGDAQGNAGDFLRIKITESTGKDLKVLCVPENTNWEAVKNVQDQVLILFSPKKTEQDVTYYFFAAITNSEKTYVATHGILIHGTGVKPNPAPIPNPAPVPVVPELAKRFDPVYMVSPNSANLTKYIAVFESLDKKNDGGNFTTYKQAWDVLVSSTADAMNNDLTTLRPLRDEVAKVLIEKTGTDHTKYDKAALSGVLKDLIVALKYVQKSRP